MEFLDLLKEYGGYLALPVVINALMMACKKGFKKVFASTWGIRLGLFLPLVLGALGGLLLPLESLQDKLLLGSALGALSHYLYKFVTVTIASETQVRYIKAKKELDLIKSPKPEVSDEGKVDQSVEDVEGVGK